MVTSEHVLLQRHNDGDATAFGELVELYRRPVYAYLARVGVPVSARDDVAQDVFFKLHKAAPSYVPERQLRAFVFTVVANSARSYARKRRVWGRFFESVSVAQEPAVRLSDAVADAVANTEAQQMLQWLDSAVQKLSPAQRDVILLHAVAQLDHHEIAQALRIPLNTVKTHLRRARVELAKMLVRRRSQEEVL